MSAAICSVMLLSACGGSGGHPSSTSTTTTVTPPTTTAPKVKPEGSGVLTQVNVHYPSAPASLQVDPTVTPTTGGLKTVFTLHVHVRSPLGPEGHYLRSYRVLLAGIRPRCAVFTLLDAAKLGSTAPVALHPPIELGWCRGPYRGTVLLETNPSCVAASAGQAPSCAHFATRYQVVGRFTFAAH